MNNEEFIGKVAALADKGNAAEAWVKRGENINRAAITPAINELRYAGRRIVDAFAAHKNGEEEKTKVFIADAEVDLDKTRHDVVDAIYAAYSDKASQSLDEIGAAVAQKYFPRYAELFALIKNMGSDIELARKDRSQRETIYCGLIEKLPELSKWCDEFAVSIAPIAERSKKAEQRADKAEQRADKAEQRAKCRIIAAGIGVLLSIVLLVDKFW